MIPSFTVTNSVNYQSSSSAMGTNPIYWIRQNHTENGGTRTHKVSTKILGLGIFMIGVILLTIGLILGLQFPNYVSEKIRRDMCIFDRKHIFFDSWVQDAMFVRRNRVYHWTLVNPDRFLTGHRPLFAVKGPYIYGEKRTLINVQFVKNKISYKTMHTQTFDEKATRCECGSNCSLNDKLTVINSAFLKKIVTAGGLDNFITAHFAQFVSRTVNIAAHGETVLRYTGCVDSECRSVYNVTQHANYTRLDLVSFGHYIENNNTPDNHNILTSDSFITSDGHLHLELMRSIYGQIINASNAYCDIFLNTSSGRFWEIELAFNDFTVHPYDVIETRFNESVNNASCLRINFTDRCSLSSLTVAFISHILQFSDWPMLLWTLSVCEDFKSPCSVFKETYETVLSFLNVIQHFVDSHLLKLVGATVLAATGNSLVLTVPQHHITIASELSNDLRSEGILTHHTSITDAFFRSEETVVSNCFYDQTDNNMAVREYNGSQFAPPGTYSDESREYFGHSFVVPPSPECRTCTAPVTSGQEFEFFIEDISRSLEFSFPFQIERHGTDLYRYVLAPDAFSDSVGHCSTINLTSVAGFELYTGVPCYKYSYCGASDETLQGCDTRQFHSYFDVEPRTGRVWGYSVNLQTSTVISPHVMGTVNSQHSNVTFLNQLVPLYWVEKSADIAQQDVQYFQDKVARLMNASCGGLIGLTLVAIVTMVFSVFVGMLSTRKNKVQPISEEPHLSSNHRL